MHNAVPLKSNWCLVQDGGGYVCTTPRAIMRSVNLATGLLCSLKASGAPSRNRMMIKWKRSTKCFTSFYLKYLTVPRVYFQHGQLLWDHNPYPCFSSESGLLVCQRSIIISHGSPPCDACPIYLTIYLTFWDQYMMITLDNLKQKFSKCDAKVPCKVKETGHASALKKKQDDSYCSLAQLCQ